MHFSAFLTDVRRQFVFVTSSSLYRDKKIVKAFAHFNGRIYHIDHIADII